MPTRISYVDGSVEPVTLAEAKLAARFDGDDLDALIAGAITAARESAEQITGRIYRPQVLRTELDDWPADAIAVSAATGCAIKYWTAGGFAALAGSAYAFAAGGIGGNGTVIAPAIGASWPALADRAAGPRVQIDLTAGPASPASVPEQVKLYIKATVAAWVRSPEAMTSTSLAPNPLHERLLDAERTFA
ncbi:head-tail connector protein [Roseateles sp. BYS96W]|uniref:Head-tail connector protein n=1 Tax=Pelomonas nitida TaxID=3299027 RepID=A0ABW7G7P1_9BURK